MRVTLVLAALAVVLSGASLAFAIDPGASASARPVPFSDTLATGMTGVDVQQARAGGAEIPRVEVFYSQYEYVVGYYGVASAVDATDRETTTRQFGRPLAIYVSDYSGAGPRLTDDKSLTVASDPAVGWVRASEAAFVVDSEARTPGGPAIVPFSDAADARDFAKRYGGTVRDWTELEPREDEPRASWLREAANDRTAWADRTVRQRRPLLDRPVSITVGEDVPTLAGAVDAAPPNTTVRLPPGTYDGNVTVETSVTIRGAGERTRIVGDNGTAIRVSAPEVGLANLSITDVGESNTGDPVDAAETAGEWDESVRTTYGYGDAAVVFDGANRSLLARVHVETPASGAIVRDSDGVVVENVSINGTADWQDGFMGVLAMDARIVVQDSTFTGGRDAVYTHHADGLVVRDNRMTGMRFGVHEMYTSGTLVRNNTARDTDIGVVVMTRPRSNVLLDNRVSASDVGISVGGSTSLVANNTLVANRYGMDLGAQRSTFAYNVLAGNDVGLRTGTIVPTNRVTGNDVIDNDRYVSTGRGPVRVWTANYWGTIPGRDADADGRIDRAFRPTGPVDSAVDRSTGAATLSTSPAVTILRRFEAAVPGLRSANVIDDEPRLVPVQSEKIAMARNISTGEAVSP
ncbi:Copper-binding periplasmic protein [Halorhabdus tiamatea SARL4B]|uniref:Copper-binding periplasmic protein n=1 Tax=Halorhabdus tiamatea SARL4B TaxID=1033806 RepID=F7PPW3_9EURY|nr:NosD domain-containing protein [Halorhabdus tiamatea]ERJ05004.1 Copper-binding periplasmic protein [Halorhabdus tiamatea SARL4B]CCQ32429.1 NosL family copper-binding protein [Halorhabdus tiamatea SARL4B]